MSESTQLGASIAELTSDVGDMRKKRQEQEAWEDEPIQKAAEYAREVIAEHEMEVNLLAIDWQMFGGTRTHGRYIWRENRFGSDEQIIKLSVNTLSNQGVEKFKQTIRHELVHAWQHQNGKPLDHGATFETWMPVLDIEKRADCRPDGR